MGPTICPPNRLCFSKVEPASKYYCQSYNTQVNSEIRGLILSVGKGLVRNELFSKKKGLLVFNSLHAKRKLETRV